MNYCTKCASYYEKPGTCNCFAEKQQEGTQWVGPTPMWVSPWWIYPLPGTPAPYPTRWETTCGSTTSAGITEHPNNSTVSYADVNVSLTGPAA